MILNTLDNLGKFEAKWDEGYFIGYSMSSKAFRVFNNRTKRVEENLHVDFLKNNPIEKGAGPNWLFDIGSLTNSMNYVPLVVTDTCCADAPESSGNSNPIATSTNPPAGHIETLAVETPIPTVSSPVLTACLDVSPKPSSDTRLIFKRVTSQDDTPSLDNILTLTNRFEDILGVTTNIDDTNGVEADLGNMEDNISASPTPTLRIHKDHPKTQIIGPVDTSNVWSLVDCLKGVRPIGTKWVLKNKNDERGIVIKNKARLVAQGHKQEDRIDYDEMSATGELNFFLCLQVLQKKDRIFLSQDKHQVTPKECHLHAVKRIFRYLKGHPKLGLWSTERGSDDTKVMVNVLTSLDAAKILTSGGVQVSISPAAEFATATVSIPTGSGSIPTASPPGTGVPTGSEM
nr:hypothetical protein [Tanacetum cinerariifolium]